MSYNVIRAADAANADLTPDLISDIQSHLTSDGWVLLRGFDMDMSRFSAMTAKLCKTITFDPARENTEKNTQKVDAGLGPIGLHIENGNTPVCPDIVAFYSTKAAFEGSQTTICDGRRVFAAFTDAQKARWSQRMTVKRTLPEELWKRYLANEHPAISEPEQVTMDHILQFKAAIPDQDFTLNPDGSLEYRLKVAPVRPSALSNGQAFANAILGPSHNYEPPVYTLEDGSEISADEIEELREVAETCTVEINWQDGDVAVIDNTRVMHGRRAIKDQDRQLFIGMGRVH
ncbi:TauD/TfdA family dioxygenase [Roseinatronobacter sp.]|uniref:TauD/TfdA family dioxygenase n=1 Tax=Roseinatronobacter sp. TaxID=1945755 RepID=UPI0025CF21A7|nr:TauD/TfdA family dioxygenase [Roseibaca sp.]